MQKIIVPKKNLTPSPKTKTKQNQKKNTNKKKTPQKIPKENKQANKKKVLFDIGYKNVNYLQHQQPYIFLWT